MNERTRQQAPGRRAQQTVGRIWQRYQPIVADRAREYALLMRWHRPIGAQLLLWPAMWALWIAGRGAPDAGIVVIFVLGVWVMRSAGCVFNDFADRHFDLYVKRTHDRPLTTGRVSTREALAVFFAMCLIALGLVLMLNRLTILLSLVGLALAATYPFMKRYTYLPQPYLGMAFGWAIPMAFSAQTGHVPPVAWLIFICNILWSTIYDTMYAMVDRDDDLKLGLKSAAILFGDLDRHIIGILQVTMLGALYLVGRRVGLGAWYDAGLAGGAALFAYQQVLIFHRRRDRCFRAFMNNNWFGAVIFAGILLDYLLH
ncbi:MAG TPA: 4-hydroxybenzoate octaprenyltransferase [Gammaproteobacteria bacterium]|nr:4-hydroxybenzoate octaprenyltransferase [Gammaproteobacteria bacterium]